MRFVSTYAGQTNESSLLEDLYKQVVKQGERLHPDLPIYGNREARVFGYLDTEPCMPWQTEEYYAAQRRTLRPATFARLHRNE